MGLKGLNRHHG